MDTYVLCCLIILLEWFQFYFANDVLDWIWVEFSYFKDFCLDLLFYIFEICVYISFHYKHNNNQIQKYNF